MSDLFTLVLTPDNPSNTTITDGDNGKVLYRVATEHGKETVTRVQSATGGTIASWEWRDVRSDVITLGTGTPMPTSAWLKKSIIPFKDTVTFQGGPGKSFKWKGNGPGLSLELFAEDDKVNPIARFKKSRRILGQSVSSSRLQFTPAQLVLDSRAEDVQELVVISFLVLEKSRRARENSTMNRADVLATPLTTVNSNIVHNGGV